MVKPTQSTLSRKELKRRMEALLKHSAASAAKRNTDRGIKKTNNKLFTARGTPALALNCLSRSLRKCETNAGLKIPEGHEKPKRVQTLGLYSAKLKKQERKLDVKSKPGERGAQWKALSQEEKDKYKKIAEEKNENLRTYKANKKEERLEREVMNKDGSAKVESGWVMLTRVRRRQMKANDDTKDNNVLKAVSVEYKILQKMVEESIGTGDELELLPLIQSIQLASKEDRYGGNYKFNKYKYHTERPDKNRTKYPLQKDIDADKAREDLRERVDDAHREAHPEEYLEE
jgi:hypothetical protein